jgi:cytochrome d ubiquinol oxidase subunit II
MSLADICVALMAVGLTAYAVLGGADFGTGLWDLTAGGPERGKPIRDMIRRSMGPVWEANHVWLIFVLVVFWTAFPVAFGSVMSTLYVPLFLAVAGIILRGTAFAVRGEAATIAEDRLLGAAFALSSLITPFCLGAAIGGIASGRVPVGNATGDALSSWLNPTSIVVGVLAVLTGAYLAAVYLAADATRAGQRDLARRFRMRALVAGALAGATAIGGLLAIRDDAPELYDGLTSRPGGVACLAVSVVAGVGTLALVWRERYRAARFCAAVAVASITVGWAFAQHPYLLPGALTVEQASAPHATLIALLASIAAGLLVIGPALLLLYRLALRGRLDPEARP